MVGNGDTACGREVPEDPGGAWLEQRGGPGRKDEVIQNGTVPFVDEGGHLGIQSLYDIQKIVRGIGIVLQFQEAEGGSG